MHAILSDEKGGFFVKKRLLVGLFSLTFVLSVTLAACGGAKTNEGKNTGTTTAGTTEAAKAESTAAELKADVTIWVYPAFEKIDQFFNEKVNAEFKKKFSGVNATIEVIPYDGGPNKVNVAIASGSTPDGLIDTPMRINGYAAKNVLVSLDKELEGIKNDVYPGMIDASLVDGKRYVIPLFATGGYTFAVNSTLAKELGTYDMLPKDHVSWTQEDFKNFIKASTEKGKSKGVYGTALWAASQSSDAVIFSFMMSAGAKVFNDEKNKIILNSAEAVKGLDLLAGMVKEGIVMPGAATLKDEDSNTL
ncbi:MAG: extracellular solute-binding protein, partial [Ruminiclostridium sp.]|nr:extracellular solute-binding protein [Ruminiclostridium sp.]